MEPILNYADFILHVDAHLNALVESYAYWTYAILFLIIFLETGIVLTPFLPGDSLIFAAGVLSGAGSLNPWVLAVTLSLAAILGDAANYWIGRRSTSWLFKEESKYLKRAYLERTEKFYEIHGKKTIVIARFIPIIRTFAPFVAGMTKMNYRQFTAYNVAGGLFWVNLFVWTGNVFGNISLVKDNFSIVILAIIAASFIPMLWEFFFHRKK